MASGSDWDAEDALSKLLQMGTVAEYESKFVMLINRVTGIYEGLLKAFYISCALLILNPKTLDESFSLAHATEASFANLQLLELLRSTPITLGEAFFRALITEACFKDEHNQAFDNTVGDQEDSNVSKQTINETTDTITSLQSDVASLEAKGSLDANEEIKKAHTRVHELEKQVEKLPMVL
ncbi:hypothetical protein Tco_1191988 [Tanacetum coccineum]